MARIDWNLRSRSRSCLRCSRPFEDGERVHSAVLAADSDLARELFAEAFAAEEAAKAAGQPVKARPEYLRADFCASCRKSLGSEPWISVWTSVFTPPPAAPEDPVKKASPEDLLRELLEGPEPENHVAAIYLLAVFLERKRILVERAVRPAPDGTSVHIYEHRRSGDILLVADPHLADSEIADAQKEIELLLGLREAEAAAAKTAQTQAGEAQGAEAQAGEAQAQASEAQGAGDKAPEKPNAAPPEADAASRTAEQ